jgi:hypothetical protein
MAIESMTLRGEFGVKGTKFSGSLSMTIGEGGEEGEFDGQRLPTPSMRKNLSQAVRKRNDLRILSFER